MMTKCPECGKEVSSKAAICVHCGCRLQVCAECGCALVYGTTVCPNCGYHIGQERLGTAEPSAYVMNSAGVLNKWGRENYEVKRADIIFKWIGWGFRIIAAGLLVAGAVLLILWTYFYRREESPLEKFDLALRAEELLKDLDIFFICAAVCASLGEIFFTAKNGAVTFLLCRNAAKTDPKEFFRTKEQETEKDVMRKMGNYENAEIDETIENAFFFSAHPEEKTKWLAMQIVHLVVSTLIFIFIALALHENLHEYIENVLAEKEFIFQYIYAIVAGAFFVLDIIFIAVEESVFGRKRKRYIKAL